MPRDAKRYQHGLWETSQALECDPASLLAILQGQVEKEAQTSPTPSLAPSDKMAQPHKSIGSAWGRLSAFNQFRVMHTSRQSYKEDMGDREAKDMPAAGIATGGPSKGSSNVKDAGEARSGCLGVPLASMLFTLIADTHRGDMNVQDIPYHCS